MELKEYQARALETALPTALNEAYLTPMIVEEIGEVFGKVAKATRDEWETERFEQEMLKEVGDVCWGVAVYAHHIGATLPAHKGVEEEDMETVLSAIIYEANNLYAYPWEVEDALEGIWVTLQAGARALTGHSFDQVLEANLAKLADRQARSVISGSGDDR